MNLHQYVEEAYYNIEGWVLPPTLTALQILDEISAYCGVSGGVCEIGVHHGRFYLAMMSWLKESAPCLAIDLFEDQSLNIDRSGKGSHSQFANHLETFFPGNTDVVPMATDSLGLGVADVVRIKEEFGSFRFFSVDGGHTKIHARHDLWLAEQLVSNGGVVIVDDFFQPDWPGVTEAMAQAFTHDNTVLAPLCIAGHKLYCTSLSYHEKYLHQLKKRFEGQSESFTVKVIDLFGWNALNVKPLKSTPVLLPASS